MTYLKLKSDKFPAPRVFSDYFEDFLGKDFPFTTPAFSKMPPVNISESKDQYVMEFSVPGRNKADFKLNVDGNLLEISSETKEEKIDKEENYTRREFSHSSFSRSFTLPETVNMESIKAEYTDGILRVILPKKEEVKTKGPKEISVS